MQGGLQQLHTACTRQHVIHTPCVSSTRHWKQHCQRVLLRTAASRAAVGIDLGTTNSVVAVLKDGETRPSVVTDRCSGGFTIPSVVAYEASNGKVLVGAAAKQQAAANPANTFYSVKRLMGRRCEEVQGLGLAYQLRDSKAGGVELVCPAADTTLQPEQVSAELLRHLLHLASERLSGITPQQVVITVPAYFNAQQRAATVEAARLAGMQQVSLLQEPVAAAMAFGFGKPVDAETLLVFDLGGGTFDLSVVDSFERIMEVLATGGDALLGGDDFDTALLQALLLQQNPVAPQTSASSSSNGEQQPAEAPSSSPVQSIVFVELLAAVEAAKCQLSIQESAHIPISAAAAVQLGLLQHTQQQHTLHQGNTHHHQQQQQESHGQQPQQLSACHLTLTRQQMHQLTAHLRQRLWQPLQPLAEACKLQYACHPSSIEQQLQGQRPPDGVGTHDAAGGSSQDPYAPKPRQLTAVLLVGGATRMPIIQQGLQVLTGLAPRSDVDPEQAVALGAAIQAAVLLGLSSGVELMDGSYVEELHNRSTGF